MSQNRVQLEPGYVLKAQPYRDTSLLIEVWTRFHGRAGLVARGARGPRSKTRALLQPLRPLLLSWVDRGELGTLSGVEEAGPASALTGEGVLCGWYLNELLLKLLTRRDPHPELFDVYVQALAELPFATEAALRRFEKRLLDELGYGLQLPTDIRANMRYRYDPEQGAVLALPGEPDTVTGQTLLDLEAERFDDPQSRREARRLLRSALAKQLGGYELETARLLRELRQRTRQSTAGA